MKKLIPLFTLACFMIVNALMAQSVTKKEADMVANRFVTEKYMSMSKEPVQVYLQEVIANENMNYLYRYDIGNLGFVIVSASKLAPPVLAYSLDQNFEMIPPVKDLFHYYEQQIQFAESSKLLPTKSAKSLWDHYLAAEFEPNLTKGDRYNYLLTTHWNQNKFYNTYCPWDIQAGEYYDYRVPNGCVALACAQIMNYHHHPKSGHGISLYIPAGYPMQYVNFSEHTYNWDAMCNRPMSYANEIAKLAHHFGVAIQMGYTADGSGAATETARKQLYQTFDYDPGINTFSRAIYDSSTIGNFVNLLKNEIDLKCPVYFAGCSESSCHAYVVDGYDETDKLHINYGWGGASDGFYAIDNFVAGWTHYDYNAEAVIHILPYYTALNTECQGHKRLTASFGYVMDGSATIRPYKAGPDCSWMVAVPTATSYTFSFDRLDLNPNVDFLTIYNGPTVESGVKAVYTGTNVPEEEITVTADSVLITFTTNGNGPETNTDYYGFLLSYQTQLEAPTCTNALIHDWTMAITDGSSEGEDYHPETNCTWSVSLNYISGFSISFPKFDLGYGDFVDVYDNTTMPPTLYKRFDIYNPPTGTELVNFSKMRVNFVSDNWDQADGFELRYWALDGVEDHSGIEDLRIYPNPVSDNMSVSFNLQESQVVNCKIMDATGKVVLAESFDASLGDNLHTMNVSNLASGLYMVQMDTKSGKTIRKILVQ